MKIQIIIVTIATIYKGHTSWDHIDLMIILRLLIPQYHMNVLKITLVLWKAHVIFWVNGSLVRNFITCGAIFYDHLENILGALAETFPSIW